jgi:copper transport protein
MRRFIYIWSCVLVLVLLPHRAQAHANLVESTLASHSVMAQAPATARLRFSEPLEPSYSRVVLLDATGVTSSTAPSRVDPTDGYVLLLALPSLPEGRYVLQWRTLSTVDGHTTQGVVPFAIGDPQAADAPLVLPPPPRDPLAVPPFTDVGLRWLTYSALSVVLGSLIFRWYAWREGAGSPPEVDRALQHVLAWIELGAAVLAALASGGMLLAASTLAGAQMFVFAVTARVGMILTLRVAVCLLLAMVLWRARPIDRLRLGTGIGAAALFSISFLSHSAAPPTPPRAIVQYMTTGVAIAFDWIHLLATAAWIGGLLPLVLALWMLRREAPGGRAGSSTTLVARFTALATAAVITLAATGTYAALQQVTQVSELWTTTYGRALALKLGLFGALLLLGGYNRWRVHPQLATLVAHTAHKAKVAKQKRGRKRSRPSMEHQNAAPTGDATQVLRVLRHLRWSIGTEIITGGLVLLAAGVLTAALPAREAASRGPGYMQTARVNNTQLTLQVVRGGIAGDLFALDVAGWPAGVQPSVLLRASMVGHGMGAQELALKEVEPHRWGARGSLLTMDGRWEIEAIVRAPGRNDVRHTFVVNTLALRTASAAPTQGPPPRWVLLCVGALLIAALSQLPTQRRWQVRLQTTSLLLLAGAFVATIVPDSLTQAGASTNPLPATPAVLHAGRAIYQQHCVSCHGWQAEVMAHWPRRSLGSRPILPSPTSRRIRTGSCLAGFREVSPAPPCRALGTSSATSRSGR